MIGQDSVGWILPWLPVAPFLATVLSNFPEKFVIASPAFAGGQGIPVMYANLGVPAGRNISPPLTWSGIPVGSRSLLLVCVDRHPIASNWIHWMVTNIPAQVNSMQEGASHTGKIPAMAKEWPNSFGSIGWGGPQPPRGSGRHQYEFILYALNVESLNLNHGVTWIGLCKALEGKAISSARMSGFFER
jgi:Raf kinase inhibitor-like YbhB/YbcL family protein